MQYCARVWSVVLTEGMVWGVRRAAQGAPAPHGPPAPPPPHPLAAAPDQLAHAADWCKAVYEKAVECGLIWSGGCWGESERKRGREERRERA
eukprot:1090950-Rhodomonas_salina.1